MGKLIRTAARRVGLALALVLLSTTSVSPVEISRPATTALARETRPPGTDGRDPAGSLAGFAARAPDVLAGPSPPNVEVLSYADVAAQLAATGLSIPDPTARDERGVGRWPTAVRAVALAPRVAERGLDPLWRATFGFDALQVDQSLTIGEPPNVTTLLRGRFDPDEVRTALRQAGYADVDVGGRPVLSFASNARIQLDSPVGRLALASMNNAAFLDDGTLVFAPTLDGIRAVLEVEAGRAPTLAANPDVAALLASPSADGLGSAYLVLGRALKQNPGELLRDGSPGGDALRARIAAREAELARMPPPRMALLGITPGGPLPPPLRTPPAEPSPTGTPVPEPTPGADPVRFRLALLMHDRAGAEIAAPVVEERLAGLATARNPRLTFAELFPVRAVAPAADAPLLLIDLTMRGDRLPEIWRQLLFARDLGFVAW